MMLYFILFQNDILARKTRRAIKSFACICPERFLTRQMLCEKNVLDVQNENYNPEPGNWSHGTSSYIERKTVTARVQQALAVVNITFSFHVEFQVAEIHFAKVRNTSR